MKSPANKNESIAYSKTSSNIFCEKPTDTKQLANMKKKGQNKVVKHINGLEIF